MSDIDTCDLFRRCLTSRRAGDWHDFIDRHGSEIRRRVQQAANRYGLLLVGPDLDEMVQDFYCRLLSVHSRRFADRTEDELWRYVICVAQSLVVDHLRQLGASKRRQRVPAQSADATRMSSPKLDPEQRLLKKERRSVFFKRCFEVVRCDRVNLELQALALALLEGWSSRDIACELQGDVSSARVDRLVTRLRRRLLQDGIRMPRRIGIRSPIPAPAT